MARHHIINGSITVKGTSIRFNTGSMDFTVEEVETTDSGSGGWQEFIPGIKRCEVSFTIFWDDTLLPNADPPDLNVGAVVPFTATLATGKTYSCDIFIKGVNVDFHDITGSDPISVEVSANSNSPVTLPTP